MGGGVAISRYGTLRRTRESSRRAQGNNRSHISANMYSSKEVEVLRSRPVRRSNRRLAARTRPVSTKDCEAADALFANCQAEETKYRTGVTRADGHGELNLLALRCLPAGGRFGKRNVEGITSLRRLREYYELDRQTSNTGYTDRKFWLLRNDNRYKSKASYLTRWTQIRYKYSLERLRGMIESAGCRPRAPLPSESLHTGGTRGWARDGQKGGSHFCRDEGLGGGQPSEDEDVRRPKDK